MPKINIPIGTDGKLDYTDESKYLDILIYKIDRTESGQVEYTSLSSNITYKTIDYPEDSNIYNKGEVGMINLLQKIYGGENGFLMLAEDYNKLLAYKKPVTLLPENWIPTSNPSLYKQTIQDENIDEKSIISIDASLSEIESHINEPYLTMFIDNIQKGMVDICCLTDIKPFSTYNVTVNINR